MKHNFSIPHFILELRVSNLCLIKLTQKFFTSCRKFLNHNCETFSSNDCELFSSNNCESFLSNNFESFLSNNYKTFLSKKCETFLSNNCKLFLSKNWEWFFSNNFETFLNIFNLIFWLSAIFKSFFKYFLANLICLRASLREKTCGKTLF